MTESNILACARFYKMTSKMLITRPSFIILVVSLLQVAPSYAGNNDCDEDKDGGIPVPGVSWKPCKPGGGGGGKDKSAPTPIKCDKTETYTGNKPKRYVGVKPTKEGHWNMEITALELDANEEVTIKRFDCEGEGCMWLVLTWRTPLPFKIHMHNPVFTICSTTPHAVVTMKNLCNVPSPFFR